MYVRTLSAVSFCRACVGWSGFLLGMLAGRRQCPKDQLSIFHRKGLDSFRDKAGISKVDFLEVN